MTELNELTISQALDGLDKKEFSALELTESCLAAMDRHRGLNAYITELPAHARARAAESDRRRASGDALPLDGIPLAIKDLYCTDGVRTTAGSRILENFVPPYESTVTEKLARAGTVMLGKANLDEFAMGSSNTSSFFGSVRSPWTRADDPASRLVPGGSSGGSAAAVAARTALGATGTDTGGSIRQPAAFTGLAGIKPTYGRCSRWGIVAFASSLDQAGVFSHTTGDCAHLLKHMAGHDPKDSTSAPYEVPDWPALMKQGIKGLKIGIPKEYRIEGLPAEIAALWDQGAAWLRDQGAEIVDISLPHTEYALPAYYIINPAEASSNLARYDGMRYGHRAEGKNLLEVYENTRGEGFGDEVKRRIMIGTYVLSAGYYDAYYRKAQQVRRKIQEDFHTAYEKVDAILTPTTPGPAFAIGENEDDPVKMYMNDVFTVTVNMAGLPGMSIPAGLSSQGLPLGLQIIGRAFDEETVFRTSYALEQAAQFTARPNLDLLLQQQAA